MIERRGEKIGWTGGFLGGFLWVLVLSLIALAQGRLLSGTIGLLLFLVAVASVIIFAPWRHPDARYHLLMTPIFLVLVLSVLWAYSLFAGGLGPWWSLPLVILVFAIFCQMRGKRWSDSGAR
ncbi:MAG: hypothetical protein M0042_13765 [Nitrospiraceae bacterium]|nr:hypothetical protein [Nitrospiraceae bacterium]